MKPHVHLSAVHGIAVIAFVVAVFGTIHLYSMSHDNQFTRAWVAGLGF